MWFKNLRGLYNIKTKLNYFIYVSLFLNQIILKVETFFLSNEKTKKEDLPKILKQIQINLNTTGECIIQKIGMSNK